MCTVTHAARQKASFKVVLTRQMVTMASSKDLDRRATWECVHAAACGAVCSSQFLLRTGM